MGCPSQAWLRDKGTALPHMYDDDDTTHVILGGWFVVVWVLVLYVAFNVHTLFVFCLPTNSPKQTFSSPARCERCSARFGVNRDIHGGFESLAPNRPAGGRLLGCCAGDSGLLQDEGHVKYMCMCMCGVFLAWPD